MGKRLLFRRVNERIVDVGEPSAAPPTCELLCECGRLECTRRVLVPRSLFVELRADTQRFVVAPGCEDPAEEVLASGPGFRVVTRARPESAGAPAALPLVSTG